MTLLASDLDHVLKSTSPDVWNELRDKRLFLTGGTGFVGTWLLESLVALTDRLDFRMPAFVLTRNPERFQNECPHLAQHPAVTLVRDFPNGEFPLVIHAATEGHFPADAERPVSTYDLDVSLTRRVL